MPAHFVSHQTVIVSERTNWTDSTSSSSPVHFSNSWRHASSSVFCTSYLSDFNSSHRFGSLLLMMRKTIKAYSSLSVLWRTWGLRTCVETITVLACDQAFFAIKRMPDRRIGQFRVVALGWPYPAPRVHPHPSSPLLFSSAMSATPKALDSRGHMGLRNSMFKF